MGNKEMEGRVAAQPGSREPSPAVSAASGFDPSRCQWHSPTEYPDHGEPVIAEYHPWNEPTNGVRYHVAWFWDGAYRQFPEVDGTAYVNRWARFRDSDGPRMAETACGLGAEPDQRGPKASPNA